MAECLGEKGRNHSSRPCEHSAQQHKQNPWIPPRFGTPEQSHQNFCINPSISCSNPLASVLFYALISLNGSWRSNPYFCSQTMFEWGSTPHLITLKLIQMILLCRLQQHERTMEGYIVPLNRSQKAWGGCYQHLPSVQKLSRWSFFSM